MKKVIARLRLMLTNNVGIKVIAVIIAAIIWLAVVNINDPEKTITIYNIPITITDEEVLLDQDMVYDSNKNYQNANIDTATYIPSSEFRASTVIDEQQKSEIDKVIADSDKVIRNAEKLLK